MPTIAEQPITRATIRTFEQGDWFAEVLTNSEDLLAEGSRVELVVGTLVLSGAIVRGGVTLGAEGFVGRYQVAGRPEWSATIAPRAYNSAASVLLKTVISDIAREVLGSSWANLVVMPPAANLDKHYERSGTSSDVAIAARDALELLGVPWYVRADGITVFAVRPTGALTTTEQILVEYRNDAIGYRVIRCEDPGAFVPGLTFDGEVIGEVVFAVDAQAIKVHVWTRAASSSFADALRTIWRRLFPRAELQGVFSYVTVGPSQSGKHDLRSAKSRHLPDVKLAESWGGGGISAELAAGTRVLLTFADGDPSTPVLVAVEPKGSPNHVPRRIFHEAAVNILMVTESAGDVLIGPPGAGETARLPLAKAPHVQAYLNAIETWAQSIDLAIAPAVLLLTPPQQLAYANAVAARVAAATSNVPAIPTTRSESA